MPGPVSANGTSFSGPVSRGEGVRADEARLLLAAPAQAGLDRVAVTRTCRCRRGGSRPRGAGCRARRGPRGGAAPRRARPTRPRRRRARAAARPRPRPCSRCRTRGRGTPATARVGGAHPRGQLARRVASRRSRARPGPAPRASRSRRAVLHVDVEARRPGSLEPGQVLLVVRRVRDREEALVGQAVGEEVVEHAAVLAAQHASTARRARGSSSRRWRGSAGGTLGVGAARLDLAHVRDVEHPDLRAHGHVLLADALVLHRHLPPGEGDEPGSQRRVACVQGRLAEGVGGGPHWWRTLAVGWPKGPAVNCSNKGRSARRARGSTLADSATRGPRGRQSCRNDGMSMSSSGISSDAALAVVRTGVRRVARARPRLARLARAGRPASRRGGRSRSR